MRGIGAPAAVTLTELSGGVNLLRASVPFVLHSVRQHRQLISNEGPNAEIGLEGS